MNKILPVLAFLMAGSPALAADYTEPAENEDKAYTAYTICAGYYSVMVVELEVLEPTADIVNTIAAYSEAEEVSVMLATAFAAVDYEAGEVDRVVEDAVTRETESMQRMIDNDAQLVGSLYDRICERMIDEGMTALGGG